MPLYVADYKADTAHLGALEHGVYLLLIMHYWQTGSLPDDDTQLARIASVSAAEWRRAKPVVEKFFAPGWKHGRIDKELAKAQEISSKRSAVAQQMHEERRANAHAIAVQAHTQPLSQPQSHLQNKETKTFKSVGEKRVNGWSPPKHGATGRGRVYIESGSVEWTEYAADFRGVHGKDPTPNEYGGKWFKTLGEASNG